METNWHL